VRGPLLHCRRWEGGLAAEGAEGAPRDEGGGCPAATRLGSSAGQELLDAGALSGWREGRGERGGVVGMGVRRGSKGREVDDRVPHVLVGIEEKNEGGWMREKEI
jgi:hypothetical protein